MGPWLSVIVPTLDEAPRIGAVLARVRSPSVESIVVDAGSVDGTARAARAHADEVLLAERGRAAQMNAGAARARGEALLFLHADTMLPIGYAEEIRAALADPRVVGGRFDVKLDSERLMYRLIGRLISVRSRVTRSATGDQGIFVRSAVFRELGGFPSVPIMEDLAFSRRLKRRGRIACLKATVTTSARRWRQEGALRTVLLMWVLRLLYLVGVSPRLLSRLYA